MFFSRILAGIFSSNAVTAQAAIADISSEKEKIKNLALGGIASGLAWVVGQPLGGLLSTKSSIFCGGFATPFWIIAGFFFLNYFLITKYFKEIYVVRKQTKHNWKKEIKNLPKLLKITHVSPWLLILFSFFF